MYKQFLFLALGLAFSLSLTAQRPPETAQEYDKNYRRRIQQEYIYGVYIPSDLGDAFNQLNQLTDRESVQKFRQADEEMAVRKLHFSLGRWIIHNWGFYEGSRLSHSLKQMGLYHPDDMARFVIRSYHRSLNKKPIGAKEQVEALAEARQAAHLQRLTQGEVLQEERKPGKDSTLQGQ